MQTCISCINSSVSKVHVSRRTKLQCAPLHQAIGVVCHQPWRTYKTDEGHNKRLLKFFTLKPHFCNLRATLPYYADLELLKIHNFFFRLQAVGIASRVMVLFWEKVVAIISGWTVAFPYRCSEQPLVYLRFIHRPKEILCWALGGKYCWSHSGPLGTYASQSLIGVIKFWQSKMNMNLANIYSLFDVFSLKIFTFKNGKFWAMLPVCSQSKYLKLCRCDFHQIQNRVSRRFNCVSLSLFNK